MKLDNFDDLANKMNSSPNTGVYTDIQNLNQLKTIKNHTTANREIAKQFESMLMQMVLKSMHDATQAISAEGESNSMSIYSDLFDKQLSLTMSNPDQGVGKEIQLYLNRAGGSPTSDQSVVGQSVPLKMVAEKPVLAQSSSFDTPEHFVKQLWNSAKIAAQSLGCSPEILLAQAALETGWGKKILPGENGGSSHNLFNIKAGLSWPFGKTKVTAVEERSGVLVKEKSGFKNYGSFMESFNDYVDFLKGNGRYQKALKTASNPELFIKAIQDAGFATDSQYGKKVMEIFKSPYFNNLINNFRNIVK